MELKNGDDSGLSNGNDDNKENKISSNDKILDTNTASSKNIDVKIPSGNKDDKVGRGDSKEEKSDDTVKVGSLYNMVNNSKKGEDSLTTQSNATSILNSSKDTEKKERVSDLTAKEIESKINSRVSSIKVDKEESSNVKSSMKEITPMNEDNEATPSKSTVSRKSYLNTSYTGRDGVNKGSNNMGTNDNNEKKYENDTSHLKNEYYSNNTNNTSKTNSYDDNSALNDRYNDTDKEYNKASYNDNYGEDSYDDDYKNKGTQKKTRKVTKLKAIMCVTFGALIVAFCVWVFMFDGKYYFTSEATVNKNKEEVKETFEKYIAALNEKKYEDMYQYIDTESKGNISKDGFTQRNKKIYSGMGVDKIDTQIQGDVTTDRKKKDYTISYTQKLNTIAGEVSFDNSVTFAKVKEEGQDEYWGMKWDHNIIHPDLKSTYKIQVETENYTPKRGSILDRNGEVLAKSDENGNRTYPQGEVCCHLVGVVGSPTQEELKELDKDLYDEHSKIGKKGLEYVYEDKLRGSRGGKINIKDEQGKDVKTIVEAQPKDGEDVKVSIDLKYQKSAYNALKERKGCFVGMDPNSGEVLALISTPTYDPNTNESSAPESDTPFVNRYAQAYCPGSSFKPINAGIGLTGNFYDENTTVSYEGKEYTRNGWGDYNLVTTNGSYGEKTLVNALAYSDNIFFGLMALDKIGRSNLMKGLDNLGFGEIFPFEQKPQKASIYATDKNTALDSDAAVANTGFGQGQLMLNPVHMASIYSTFVKDGSMVQPTLEIRDAGNMKYYKENVFSKDAVSKINEGLKAVVQRGTATAAKGAKVSVAGKTGTAELKASREEKNGQQNGWFCGYTFDTDKPMVFVTFTEDVGEDHALVVRKATQVINGCY